jgi:hypothetical protein
MTVSSAAPLTADGDLNHTAEFAYTGVADAPESRPGRYKILLTDRRNIFCARGGVGREPGLAGGQQQVGRDNLVNRGSEWNGQDCLGVWVLIPGIH